MPEWTDGPTPKGGTRFLISCVIIGLILGALFVFFDL